MCQKSSGLIQRFSRNITRMVLVLLHLEDFNLELLLILQHWFSKEEAPRLWEKHSPARKNLVKQKWSKMSKYPFGFVEIYFMVTLGFPIVRICFEKNTATARKNLVKRKRSKTKTSKYPFGFAAIHFMGTFGFPIVRICFENAATAWKNLMKWKCSNLANLHQIFSERSPRRAWTISGWINREIFDDWTFLWLFWWENTIAILKKNPRWKRKKCEKPG